MGALGSVLCAWTGHVCPSQLNSYTGNWARTSKTPIFRQTSWHANRAQRPLNLNCEQTDLTLTLDIENLLLSPFSPINPSGSFLSGSGVSPEHGGPTPRHLPAAAATSSASASCSLTDVILVGLRLALGALGLGVGRARRVRLLH